MVRVRQRSNKRAITAVVLSLGLIAAACGDKKNGSTTDATTGASQATEAPSSDTDAPVVLLIGGPSERGPPVVGV